jgi:hypothetical protein
MAAVSFISTTIFGYGGQPRKAQPVLRPRTVIPQQHKGHLIAPPDLDDAAVASLVALQLGIVMPWNGLRPVMRKRRG